MFSFFFALIFYRATIKTKPGTIATLPSYFNFQKGGNYTIKTNDGNIYSFFFCTKREFTSFIQTKNEDLCVISGFTENGEARGIILSAGEYQLLIYTQIFRDGEVTATLHNPGSFLDAQIQPCLFSKPVFAGLLSLLFLLWLVNWALNFAPTFTLHEYLTIAYLVTIAHLFVHFGELWHQHRSDDLTYLTQVRITLRFFHFWTLFSAMLMAAKGWCIVHTSLPRMSVLRCFGASCVIAVPLILLEHVDVGKWNYLILAFSIVSVAAYYQDLVRSIERASAYVVAHLVVISESGIDPSTTPVFQKFRIFRGTSAGLLAYFFLQLIISAFEANAWFGIPFFVQQLIVDSTTAALLVMSGALFRLRRERVNGYMMIGDITEEEEPRCFNRDDIRAIAGGGFHREGMRDWVSGMTLPPQPVFTDDIDAQISQPTVAQKDIDNLENRGDESFLSKDDKTLKDLTVI